MGCYQSKRILTAIEGLQDNQNGNHKDTHAAGESGPLDQSSSAIVAAIDELKSELKSELVALKDAQNKPNMIVSGIYYDCIESVWEFGLEKCNGNFHGDFQRPARCSHYDQTIRAIFKQQLLKIKGIDENKIAAIDSGTEVSSPLTPPKHNVADPSEGKTPTRHNGNGLACAGGSAAKIDLDRSSLGSISSKNTNQSSSRSSKGKGNGNGGHRSGHIFGGSVKDSTAHLCPPESPACNEFYENILPCFCGPLEDFSLYQAKEELGLSDREAQMHLIRALAKWNQNKIALPIEHAGYFDNDMKEGTLVLIPVMTKEEALTWDGEPYSVVVVADSDKTYRYCDMNPQKLPWLASPDEVRIATNFIADCTRSLGYSLVNHKFHALDDEKMEARSKSGETLMQSIYNKAVATKKLQSLIRGNGNKVIVPRLKEPGNMSGAKLLKINLGKLPYLRPPPPMMLGMKSAICLHKFATKVDATIYKSADGFNVEDYAKEENSMMLLPACEVIDSSFTEGWEWASGEESDGQSVYVPGSSCPSTPPREITITTSMVTPED